MSDLLIDAPETLADDGWIGARPSQIQIAALLLVGSIGMLIAGIQPVLLGALLDEHRLSAASLGLTSTAEFLTLGIGLGVAGSMFPPDRLRLRGLLAALVLVVADIAGVRQSGTGLIVDRAVAGLAEGVLIWLPAMMIARASRPARWAAIFLILQGALQVAFAALLPLTLMKGFGANGALMALAGASAAAIALLPLLPDRMGVLARPAAAGGGLSADAVVSLASVFMIYAFFLGFFAYLGDLATQAGLSPEQCGYAISLAVGLSILGSGAAAVIADRVPYLAVCLVCLPVNLFVLGALYTQPSPANFLLLSSLFGFFWGVFMPYQTPLVITADPTRRAAVIQPGVQGIGAASGPLLCSFFVSADARGALGAAGACLIASFVLAMIVQARRRARSAPGGVA